MENGQPNDNSINMYQLAKEFLDNFPFFIRGDLFIYPDAIDDELTEFIEDAAARVTPDGFIITNASYIDLYNTLVYYIIFEVKNRLQNMINAFDKEEKSYENLEYFKIEVESDGD